VRDLRRGAGAEEAVEDEVAGVGGDLKDPLEKPLRLIITLSKRALDRPRGRSELSTSVETGPPIGVEKGPPLARTSGLGHLPVGRRPKGMLESLKNARGNLGHSSSGHGVGGGSQAFI
jgi:hypothetical protein